MATEKKTWKWFSIMDYEKEAEYLGEMHRQGWKLKRVAGFGVYTFEACTPEDVVYQLDYNQDGMKHKTEYIQMFQDFGWEYLFDFVGYSYFRKPAAQMEGEEKIFCDDASRLEMMERVFKGRVLPLIAIFLCIIVPQLGMQIQDYDFTPFRTFLFWLFLTLFVLYLVIFLQFAGQYFKFKKRIG